MKLNNILKSKIVLAYLCLLLSGVSNLYGQSGIYAGGPVYYNRDYSINELKNSGFTHVVVWTIHIDGNGNFNFNAEFPLVQNGAYVGGSHYPNFAGDIASLKSGATSIRRVEFCLSGWGSGTFDNIRNLINSQGTGSGSILYRNFQALKNTFPAVDAIGFDDESTYDVNSATALAVMLSDMGFKVSLVPYTASSFWISVANNTNSQRPGTIDRVDLQCYAGGAGNNPCNWNFGSIPVFAGLWDAEKNESQVESQLSTWKNSCGIDGGFMWLYDDFRNSSRVAAFATAINNVFPTINGVSGLGGRYEIQNRYSGKYLEVDGGMISQNGANVQQWSSTGGYNQKFQLIEVNTGVYRIMSIESGKCVDISGVSTTNGANVHQWDYVGGANQHFRAVDAGGGYYKFIATHSNKLIEVGGYSTSDGGNVQQWEDAGQSSGQWRLQPTSTGPIPNGTYVIQNRNSGLYLDVDANLINQNGCNVQQWQLFNTANQQFRLTNIVNNTYSIISVASGKSLDISGGSTANGANVQQWDYVGVQQQQFNIVAIGGAYYKIIATHSNKLVEVAGFSTSNGGNVQQWEDAGQLSGHWQFISPAKSAITDLPQEKQVVTLFPNPAENEIFFKGIETGATIDIYNALGSLVYTQTEINESQSVNIESLNQGLYVVLIKTVSGEISRLKFLKD